MNQELKNRLITGISLLFGFFLLLWLSAQSPVFHGILIGIIVLFQFIAASEWALFSTDGKFQRKRRVLYMSLAFLVCATPFVVFASPVLRDLFFDKAVSMAGLQAVDLALVGALLTTISVTWISSSFSLFMGERRQLHSIALKARELYPAMGLIGVGGGSVVLMLLHPQGLFYFFLLILIVAANDSVAYFAGRAIGGPKLAPSVSPGKTVSGAASGLVAGAVISQLAVWVLSGSLPASTQCYLIWVPVALVAGAAGQLGDLTKSYLKRLHAVKDSGTILPGHGGILDRIDGYLGSAPLFLIAILFLF